MIPPSPCILWQALQVRWKIVFPFATLAESRRSSERRRLYFSKACEENQNFINHSSYEYVTEQWPRLPLRCRVSQVLTECMHSIRSVCCLWHLYHTFPLDRRPHTKYESLWFRSSIIHPPGVCPILMAEPALRKLQQMKNEALTQSAIKSWLNEFLMLGWSNT